jgi:hypothetical protein
MMTRRSNSKSRSRGAYNHRHQRRREIESHLGNQRLQKATHSGEPVFGGRTFDFEATHNAAAAAVSLGIAWVHRTPQESGGPQAGQS